ncbi:hypothetical protein FRC06_006575 [Ceratobasidium sp. 370]|nr:hypothetical protein FRC06_006575 [Ceratobasidium sp. 370]
MVDDSLEYSPSYPTGIQYFGTSWLTNNTNHNLQRFNGTSHVARALGDGFIFSFRGSSISWYADGDKFGGPITLLLDGTNITVNNYAPSLTLKRNLWTSPSLDSGDHQIIVINTGGTLIGLDNLVVTPNDGGGSIAPANLGPGATNVPAGTVVVDNADNSLKYNGSGWQSVTGTHFQGSMHSTNNPGDSCTFTFTGTQLFYFVGDLDNSASIGISVDGGSTAKVDNTPNGNTRFAQKLVWSSPTLSDGQHTATITHVGNPGDLAGVDFFMYQPSSLGGSDPGGPGGSGGGSGGNSDSKSVPTGAIIGAAVGGVVLLALIILAVLLVRRRGFPRSKLDRPDIRYYPSYDAYHSAYHSGKESTMSSGPGSTQHYGSGGLDSPRLRPTEGGMSVYTNFAVPGYTGHPEVHEPYEPVRI